MPNETYIQQTMLPAISYGNVRMFRNNVGMQNGVRYGLCTGSSDLIGFTSKTITADDVGKTIAVFTAIEIKTEKGRVSEPQKRFIEMVKRFGGISGVCRSIEEAQKLVGSELC
jgi:hypothetical protein